MVMSSSVSSDGGRDAFEDADAVDYGICAVDADSVGCVGGTSGAGCIGTPVTGSIFDVPRVHSAVVSLQKEDLRVILVSRRELAPLFEGHSLTIESSSLLHVKAQNETIIDLLRIAEEYSCPFVTNTDVGLLKGDWRLPVRRQQWLKRVLPSLHWRFAFNAEGRFGVASDHLRRRGPTVREEPPPPPPARTTALAWLDARPSPPTSPVAETSLSTLHASSDSLVKPQTLAWSFDDEWPRMAVLRPRSPLFPAGTAHLCILCDDKSKGLFPYAMELSAMVLLSEQTQEIEDDESLRLDMLALVAEANWSCTQFTTGTCVGGRDQGLRGIGVGSNAKARKRAARIALAAMVRSRLSYTHTMEDPDEMGSFAALVSRAQRLFTREDKEFMNRLSSSQRSCLPTWQVSPPPLQQTPGPPCSRPSALFPGRVAVALAAYEAEGTGYLRLRPGDRICVKVSECYPPDANCKYASYLYGALADSPTPLDGWFPYDLITLM